MQRQELSNNHLTQLMFLSLTSYNRRLCMIAIYIHVHLPRLSPSRARWDASHARLPGRRHAVVRVGFAHACSQRQSPDRRLSVDDDARLQLSKQRPAKQFSRIHRNPAAAKFGLVGNMSRMAARAQAASGSSSVGIEGAQGYQDSRGHNEDIYPMLASILSDGYSSLLLRRPADMRSFLAQFAPSVAGIRQFFSQPHHLHPLQSRLPPALPRDTALSLSRYQQSPALGKLRRTVRHVRGDFAKHVVKARPRQRRALPQLSIAVSRYDNDA